jgi:signal transduction histidine kinase
VTVVLGLLLAGRLVRRLRSLRDTALLVADLGPVAEMPSESSRDEVGDLTRALATMQGRLREQEQSRRAFVATASHELRTPLSSLRLILDMLRDDLRAETPDIGHATRQADLADLQAERLAMLAGELLDLSRIDAATPLRNELVDLGEIARSVLAEFEVRIEETGRRVSLSAPRTVWAMGDPSSIAQIVRIVVDNAMRHSPPDAEIDIVVGQTGERATLRIHDGGPGVLPEDSERIFERFERGSNPQNAPGFGLGLAIGRELARRMDGDLSLQAAGTDPGAAFRLDLAYASAP